MKNNTKNQNAWYFYDFAASAFTTVVITVFLGPYLTSVAKSAAVDGYLNLFGLQLFADSFFTYCISVSVILQVLILPAIGAIIDETGLKKQFLGIFALLGSISTMLLFFLNGNNYLLGGISVVFANVFYGASFVVYNSMLNDVAEEDDRDRVSSNGYAFGYIGGGILLAINLALVSFHESLNIDLAMAVRLSLFSAGFWWLIFSLIPYLILKNPEIVNKIGLKKAVKNSFSQIVRTIKDAKNYPHTLHFLIAYLIFNDGVQAVIVVSAQFGQEALKLDISTLTTVILMVQFVAFFGAKLFNFIAEKINSKNALVLSLIIWSAVTIYAYGFLDSLIGFYAMAFVVGLVLGGTQALSRSLFSLMLPLGKSAEYFSLYEISERGTSWMGPLLFGLSLQFTGSYHFAILSLIVFFVLGLALLLKFDVKSAIVDSGNKLPLIYSK